MFFFVEIQLIGEFFEGYFVCECVALGDEEVLVLVEWVRDGE